MGHLQKMTAKQRMELQAVQYMASLESRRGHNHKYLTDELSDKLGALGYVQFGEPTDYEEKAIGWRDDLRKQGNYARIVCLANRLRIKTYAVFYRPRG